MANKEKRAKRAKTKAKSQRLNKQKVAQDNGPNKYDINEPVDPTRFENNDRTDYFGIETFHSDDYYIEACHADDFDIDDFDTSNFDANGLFLHFKQKGHEFIKWIGFDKERENDESIFDQPDEGGVCVISDVQKYNIEDLNKDSTLNFKIGDWYLAEILPGGDSLLHGPFGYLNVAVLYGYKLGVKSYRCALSPAEPAPSQSVIDEIRPELIKRIQSNKNHLDIFKSIQRGQVYVIALIDGRCRYKVTSEQEYLEQVPEKDRDALTAQFSLLTTEKIVGYTEVYEGDNVRFISYVLTDDEVLSAVKQN